MIRHDPSGAPAGALCAGSNSQVSMPGRSAAILAVSAARQNWGRWRRNGGRSIPAGSRGWERADAARLRAREGRWPWMDSDIHEMFQTAKIGNNTGVSSIKSLAGPAPPPMYPSPRFSGGSGPGFIRGRWGCPSRLRLRLFRTVRLPPPHTHLTSPSEEGEGKEGGRPCSSASPKGFPCESRGSHAGAPFEPPAPSSRAARSAYRGAIRFPAQGAAAGPG